MTGMPKMLLLGIAALVAGTACGQTARDQPRPMAAGGGAGSFALDGSAGHVMGTAGGGSAGQVADTPGVGGNDGTSSVRSAVAECENYCGALMYLLPAALCEDWTRDGWDPEFCGVDTETSCADYCTHVYETISTACAAALPAAIRCVAPTYATGIIPADPCWYRDCSNQLYTVTSACYGLRERLAAARALWGASGIAEYDLQYGLPGGGKADIEVRAGGEVVAAPPDAVAWTVPKLFDEVERYLHTPGVAPAVTYDAKLGYVVSLGSLQGCGAVTVVDAVAITSVR
jgi:hypothetical protein